MIDFQLILDSLPFLLKGMMLTIDIAVMGCVIGITLGTVCGLASTSKNTLVKTVVGLYVNALRGTPMLIQILFVYFVLPQLGINMPTLWAATVAIGLNSSAYISGIIRSGIMAVSGGQVEAARVLGFSRIQIMRYIVLPQAIRVVLPALGNEFITLLKDSSLASIIGVQELTKAGDIIRSRTHDAITMYCIVALLYLILTSMLSYLIHYAEKRMNHHA